MYKDFTISAEAMRRERYRVASARRTSTGHSLQIRIGQALMRLGQRLTDTPVVRTDIETASV